MSQPGFENPSPAFVQGNKAVIVAPFPVHSPSTVSAVRLHMVHWAHWGVENRNHFIYTETARRSVMFHRKPGDLSGGPIYADCSQFYSAIGHWCGIHTLTDTDYTGTLLSKGKQVPVPAPGDCVIFGGGNGDHAAMITEKAAGKDWWTIGFGHQGAPERVLLSGMTAWFKQHGMPGVRYRSFSF